MKVHNKLVRDKIPEIIEVAGKRCAMQILTDDEYIVALEAKLTEEVAEYQKDKNIKEIADVIEVCMQFVRLEDILGMTWKKLEKRKLINEVDFKIRYF